MNSKASTHDQVDVVLLGFDGLSDEAAIDALTRTFGISPDKARQLMSSLPATVARHVSPLRADYFRRALQQIGGRVSLSGLPQGALSPETTAALGTSEEPAAPASGRQANANVANSAAAVPGATGPQRTLMQFAPQASTDTHEPAASESRPPSPPRTLLEGTIGSARTLLSAPQAPPSRAARTLPSQPPAGPAAPPASPSPLAEPSVVPMLSPARPADGPALGDGRSKWFAGPRSTSHPTSQEPPGSAGWGRLMGLSTQPPAPEGSDEAAGHVQVAFTPATLDVSSRNVELEEGSGSALELDEVDAPQRPPEQEPEAESMPSQPASDGPGPILEPTESSPAPSSLPPTPSSQPPRRATRRVGYQDLLALDGPNIERSLWEALSVPFMGKGMRWISALCVGYGLTALSGHAALALPGGLGLAAHGFSLLCMLLLFGMTLEFFQQVFWASLRNRKALASGPRLRPKYVTEGYFRAGAHLLALGVAALFPATIYLMAALKSGATNAQVMSSLAVRLLFFVPVTYVPMCLTTASMGHRVGAAWAVMAGVRAILRAPVRYAFVVFGSGLALLISGGCFAFLAAITGHPMWMLTAAGLPISIGTAIAAAMMAHLIRDRSDLFA